MEKQDFAERKGVRVVSIFLFLIFFSLTSVFSFGRREIEEEVIPINPQWTLCITAFDVSAMSPAWQTAGDVAARNLASTLQNLSFHFRTDEETGYYQNYAWARARAGAARRLAEIREERDLLIFKGDPPWRYERNLREMEESILQLEERLREIDALAPVVEGEPVFQLCANNLSGVFPEPPTAGGERRFAIANSLDAFITGSFSEFYGRVFLEIKMYTLHTNSFSYEDTVLFSSDDFNLILGEVSNRLAEAVSVTIPSVVLVRTDPPDAMIIAEGSFLGSEEARTFSPGTIEISAFVENHYPAFIELDLNSGELAEVYFNLTPFAISAFEIDVPGEPGSRVYQGSLFMGEAPLTLELPSNEYSYVSVETPEGEIGTGIFRDNSFIRGSANFIEGENGGNPRAEFFTAPPLHKEDGRVENARRNFYRSWGTLWITLPLSMLIGGVAGNWIDSHNRVESGGLYILEPEKRQEISNRAMFGRVLTIGTYALIGGALGYTAFNIFRYLRASMDDATPIAIVPPPPEPEEPEEPDEPDEPDESELEAPETDEASEPDAPEGEERQDDQMDAEP